MPHTEPANVVRDLVNNARLVKRDTAHASSVGSVMEKSGLFEPAPLTKALYRGLELVLAHHGASSEIRMQLENQLSSYLDSSLDETVWLKRAKWTLAYPLSKYLRNELPPAPDQAFVPTGGLRAWMRQRLVSFCRRNTHLWYSWLQCKRCALPASQDIIEKTYDSHLKALTSPDLGDPWVIETIFTDQAFRAVLDRVRDAVTRDCPSLRVEDCRTSLSACFEEKRSTGGQHHYLRSLCLPDEIYSDELVKMRYFPRAYVFGSISAHVQEIRSPYGLCHWKAMTRSKRDDSIRLRCTIQAILEPMKVRVISKGEALPYYLARPIQKAMHSCMRKMDCFRLIGAPLCPTNLIDLKEKAKSDWKWFSIDYSAATDGLSWRYSGKIFKYIISGLPADLQRLAMQVLGPHDLYYPTSRDHECPWISGHSVEKRGTMSSGQLMGSILSFPVLCLANLGVYLTTMRMEQAKWTTEERLRHVLINGDDMVYAGPEHLWDTHVDIGKSVGLNMSVGKAYVHDEYLNVNSTSVLFDLKKPCTPWRIDYLNTGLFFGQHKVMGKSDGDDHVPSITPNIGTVLAGSLPGKQCELLEHMLNVHKEAIKEECKIYWKRGVFTRNLFLPQSVGGMGIRPPPGFRFRLNGSQRRYALQKLLSFPPGVSISKAIPLPGYPLELVDEPQTPYAKAFGLEREAPRCGILPEMTAGPIKVKLWVSELVNGFHPHVVEPAPYFS